MTQGLQTTGSLCPTWNVQIWFCCLWFALVADQKNWKHLWVASARFVHLRLSVHWIWRVPKLGLCMRVIFLFSLVALTLVPVVVADGNRFIFWLFLCFHETVFTGLQSTVCRWVAFRRIFGVTASDTPTISSWCAQVGSFLDLKPWFT